MFRLGDTGLWVEVEKDMTVYGDECKFGGGSSPPVSMRLSSTKLTTSLSPSGKSLRDGQGQATNKKDVDTLDLVITNALIIDWSGIYKADVGVKDGHIKAIGKAGNPDVMEGVDPDMIVGVNTEVSILFSLYS